MLFALGNVANESAEFVFARRLDWGDGQFDGELMAIAMQPRHFDARVQHRPFAGKQKTLQAPAMRLAILGRNDRFMQYLPERFFAAPAENLFRLAVPAGDDACGIHLYHGIHRGFQGGEQARFILAMYFHQGAELARHFIEAVTYQTELVARVELDPFVQVALGKGAQGAHQRLDVADDRVVDADRQIDHQQEHQHGDGSIGIQRVLCPIDARTNERFRGRQQYVMHLRVAPVDFRRGDFQEVFG